MIISSTSIIGEIVRHNYKTASVFEEFGIDFCCGGNVSIDQACTKKGISGELVIKRLQSLTIREDADAVLMNSLSLTQLSNYIIDKHHTYINETSPFLQKKMEKLCAVHGNNHSELFEVKALFDEASRNLAMHMKKEEFVVFPFIRLADKINEGIEQKAYGENTIRSYLDEMKNEHDIEGERFRMIRELTKGYQIPSDACNTYEVTYKTLEAFEQDLHRHIHLENNILFPGALHKLLKVNEEG